MTRIPKKVVVAVGDIPHRFPKRRRCIGKIHRYIASVSIFGEFLGNGGFPDTVYTFNQMPNTEVETGQMRKWKRAI